MRSNSLYTSDSRISFVISLHGMFFFSAVLFHPHPKITSKTQENKCMRLWVCVRVWETERPDEDISSPELEQRVEGLEGNDSSNKMREWGLTSPLGAL